MKLRTLSPIGLPTLVFLLAAPWSRVCAEIPVALVRHAPTISGTVEGSVRQMLAESVTLNGEAAITEDLLLPGTPSVRLNGHPSFGGTVSGSGAASPTNHVVTLSGNARLRFLRTRTDAVLLPGVTAPTGPTGTRSVTLKNAGQSAGDFATVCNLTLDDKAGQVAVPPGVYGDFTAEGKSGFVLGVAGATQPATYAFQRLTLNGEAPLQVAGPVVVTVANGFSAKGEFGSALHPAWLSLNLYSGGVKLEGDGTIYGYINAPNGAVIIDGKSRLVGGVTCDQLTINGEGRLRVLANTVNQPPQVSLTSPLNGATFVAPAAFTLTAMAADADGSVAKVEFYQGAAKLGEDASAPFEFAVTSLVAGSYAFSARAYDNFNAVGVSSPLNLTVTNPTLPPVVTLTVPADDTVFNAPAIILLSVTASDPDGTIARVEFFQGTTKLGEVSSPPFEFSWPNVPPGAYSLTAKAYDNGGASTVSEARAVTVQVGLPYFTGFEVVDGYASGTLAGQAGWLASVAAIVTDTLSYQGAQSIRLAANGPPTLAALRFPDYTGPTVAFVEFFAQPAAGVAPDSSAFAQVEAAHVAFVQAGAMGELYVLNGNGVGAGVWQPTGFKVALTPGGQSSVWIRLTLREDFAAKRWDLFANGQLIACDLGFVDNASTAFARFALIGREAISSAFDEFYAGFDNPLFVDADKDGMPDAWESAHGLNPAVNDRNGDPDGDGRTNAQEYQAGTAPDDYYDGTLPVITSLVSGGQPGSVGLVAVKLTRLSNGAALANAPLTLAVTTGASQISATAGDALSTQISVRTDSQGVARGYVVFATPLGSEMLVATARSGSQVASLSIPLSAPTVQPTSTGMRLWLKADAGLVADVNGLVSVWPDQSGRGNNATQSDSNAQPLRVNNAANGNPVVRFDGAHDWFSLPNFMNGATEGEIFVVVKARVAPSDRSREPWSFGGNFGAAYPAGMVLWDDFGSTTQWELGTTSQDLTAYHLYNAGSRTNDWIARINGTKLFSSATNTVSFRSNPLIGRTPQFSDNYFFDGDLAEIIVYDRVLTEPDRTTVSVYLNQKYLVQGSVPPAPANLHACAISPAQVSLTWQGAEGGGLYDIERRVAGPADFIALASVGNSLCYYDTTAVSQTQYEYRVRARSLAGPGPYSAIATVATVLPPLSGIPTTNARLWLRADAGVVSSSSIMTWQDQSGRANDAFQGDPNSAPQIVSNALNGRPVLRFNGSNQYLNLPDLMSGAAQAECVLVLKAGADPMAGSHPFWQWGQSYALAFPYSDGHIYDGFASTGQWALGSAPSSLATCRIYDAASRPGDWRAFLDGSTIFSSPANTVYFSSAVKIGRAGSSYWLGDVAEILIFDRNLTSGERNAVGRYLTDKYGLTIPLYSLLLNDLYGDANHDGVPNWQEVEVYGTDPFNADTNHNGLPDSWEVKYFGQIGVDLDADASGDGITNAMEYVLGRSPLQPAAGDSTDALRLRVYLPRK